jgi:fructose-1,6-bisphosphatase/inositol monophosphatase family enzyme
LDLPVHEIERYHAAAVELAAEARRIVKPALERGFSVETKADASLVTDVDRGIERRLRELSARLNFTRHLDEGHLFESLTRRYPNHRIYRAAYAHTAVVMGAADAMVDMHNHVWDLAPSQVLIEEAGGRYAVVRDFPAPDGERILSAVFGQPAVVDDLVALFRENRAP